MSNKSLWIISLVISCLLFLATLTIVARYHAYYNPYYGFVVSPSKLNQFLSNYIAQLSRQGIKVNIIPTGFYIQSFKFVDSDTVYLSGYIWQKFPASTNPKNTDFLFPEAIGLKLSHPYRSTDRGVVTLGWYFETQIIKSFLYDKFPLDNKLIWIRLWPEGNNYTILIPDYSSYDLKRNPIVYGIDPEIVMRGYYLERTFFDYKLLEYETNFGLKHLPHNFSLELYFNVLVKRYVLTELITKLLPLFVALGFTFALLFTITFDDRKKSIIGFNLHGIIGACSALLFVVLVSHIQLRSGIPGGHFIYIEYIYFVVYFGLFYVVVNAFTVITLTVQNVNFWLLQYEDNLLARISFLPLIFLLILLSTIYKFLF